MARIKITRRHELPTGGFDVELIEVDATFEVKKIDTAGWGEDETKVVAVTKARIIQVVHLNQAGSVVDVADCDEETDLDEHDASEVADLLEDRALRASPNECDPVEGLAARLRRAAGLEAAQ